MKKSWAIILLLLFTQVAVHSFPSKALAQAADPDEAYDPFSDYSEFDEASDEEADINFFKNGRFFTTAFQIGPRGYTDNLSKIYNDGPAYGLQLSYFFDLRMALTLGFTVSDSSVNFTTNHGVNSYSGTVDLTSINADLKYYFNTQNVTRGLADLNPYVIGGFSQITRKYSFATLGSGSTESTMGVDGGLGIELPLMRRKAYWGAQLTYHYVNFSDENKDILPNNGAYEHLDNTFNGDFYDLLFMIGMNF